MKRQATKYVLLLSIATLIISCTQKSTWNSELNWERLDIHSLPSAADYPNDGAVVLHDEVKIETFGDPEDGWTSYRRHRIVKIFNIRGHQFANIAIPYSPGNEINELLARTISPSGKITVVNPENIYDISLYPNFMLYSDQMSKLFTFPAIENGSIVEYKYEVRYNGHNYGNSWSFQDNVPVLYSRFEINIPADAEPFYKISGIEIAPQIKKAPEEFKSKYVWEANDLPAIEPEIGMPVMKNTIARLKLASNNFETWKEVADWYGKLSEPQMVASENLKDLVNTLTKGMVENEVKLKAIYEWIINNIRYISVSIGIGSYQPHPASEVLQNRYGDCKDLTTLLCTMAKEAGIDVFPAIISTWYNGEVDTSIVSVGQFNHVIAFYPIEGDSGIWIEPTDQVSAFKSLPWYDQGRNVLVAMGDSSKFIQTPQENYLSNRSKTTWKVELRKDGSATIEAENRVWGAHANNLRFDLMLKSHIERREWMEDAVEEKCLFSNLDSLLVNGDNPIHDPLILKYQFRTEKFADRINEDLSFCPGNISEMNLSDYFEDQERIYPVRFKYGMQQQYYLEIELPQGWVVITEEIDKKIESQFGHASWRWYTSDNTLHIQNQFILKGEYILPEDYAEFKSFLKKVRLQELETILMSRK